MTLPYLYPVVLPVLSGLVAGLAVFGVAAFATRRSARRPVDEPPSMTVFQGRLVFEGRCLLHGDGPVFQAFSDPSEGGDDWDRAVALVGPEFPFLAATRSPPALSEGEVIGLGGKALVIRQEATKTILTFGRASAGVAQSLPATSRVPSAVTDGIPFPIWLKGGDGSVEWVNHAYLELVPEHGMGREDAWPPPDLFDPESLPDGATPGDTRRLPILGTDEDPPPLFEVHAHKTSQGTLYTAVSAEPAVRAERGLRDFTQTLTKTFAHLTVGLAIFDRSRRMILFNPALTEMTGLSAASMTIKPTLSEFLDRLRERRIAPEPKDYSSWRRKLTALEAAASSGEYEETWSLPTGQTYRVTGRPHPDGAIIFLFEDITAEISLTRRFRAELEIGQAVIDTLEDAIAVFASDGTFAMANAAYVELWDHDPDTDIVVATVADLTAHWHARTAPTPIWGDLRDFVRQERDRAEWHADVILADGRPLSCRFVPLSGGGTVVSFRPGVPGERPALEEARRFG